MQTGANVARALRAMADTFDHYEDLTPRSGLIARAHDENGNAVGYAKIGRSPVILPR